MTEPCTEINANCSNLLANYYYCVEPYPAFSTTTTTALATTGTNFTMITTFSYPLVTATATSLSYETITAPGVAAPTNVAPGTRTAACGYYYDIQVVFLLRRSNRLMYFSVAKL